MTVIGRERADQWADDKPSGPPIFIGGRRRARAPLLLESPYAAPGRPLHSSRWHRPGTRLVAGMAVTHLCCRDTHCAQCCVAARPQAVSASLWLHRWHSIGPVPAEGEDDIRSLLRSPMNCLLRLWAPQRTAQHEALLPVPWLAPRPVLLSARTVAFTRVHSSVTRRSKRILLWSHAPSSHLCRREEALLP